MCVSLCVSTEFSLTCFVQTPKTLFFKNSSGDSEVSKSSAAQREFVPTAPLVGEDLNCGGRKSLYVKPFEIFNLLHFFTFKKLRYVVQKHVTDTETSTGLEADILKGVVTIFLPCVSMLTVINLEH